MDIHARMGDGPSYSLICYTVCFLRCIPCQTHFTRLFINHKSCWEMVAQDRYLSSTYWRDDYYFIGCSYNFRLSHHLLSLYFPPNTSILAPSPRPKTIIPSTLTPIEHLYLPLHLSPLCYIHIDLFTFTSTPSHLNQWMHPHMRLLY